MKYLYLAFLLILSLATAAQTAGRASGGYARGTVYDAGTKEPIQFATVSMLYEKDSTYIKSVETDGKGRFRMTATPGNYILEITYVGYKTFLQNFNISPQQKGHAFNDIFLEVNSILLGETVVEGKVPDVVVKGDTIEFNAASYSAQESDMLQDIIKNIPGIEVDEDNNITANGKPVNKILVDGKEFFGNDIPMALANLPANMIKRLQLYKEESETAQITGFKDKDPEQVLNLVVKDELKQSLFGEVKAGYGSDDKYSHKLLANYMRNDNQISVVGNMDNAGNDNFSYGMNNGIEKAKNIGANGYLQSSEKIKVGGNVRYGDNETLIETLTNTQTFLTAGDRISTQNSTSLNKRDNVNFGVNLEWNPDSLTKIFARTSISINNSDSRNTSSDFSYVAGGDTTSVESANTSRGDGYSMSNYVAIGRDLNGKGRTLGLTINNTIREDNSTGTNYSLSQYTGATPDNIIDQRNRTESKTENFGISVSYVEPLGKDHRLQFAYSYRINNSDRLRDVRIKDGMGEYTIVDSAYSRYTENRYTNQSFSLNYQMNKKKYNLYMGISVEPTLSRSKVTLGDSIIDNLKQNVINYSPTVNFNYKPDDKTTFDISYSGNTSHPSINQLSADTVIVNALRKYYGNPNLKPTFRNNLYLSYNKSDYEKNRYFMVFGSFGYSFNNIVNYSTIDDLGNSINTYRNVNGNINANISASYNTPFRNKKFSISLNTYTGYYKNTGFTNGDKAITHNIILNENITLKFKSPKFETNLKAGINYNITQNNLTSVENRNNGTYTLNHFLLWKLPNDFAISSTLNCTYYTGYEDNFKNSEILWNASISKEFLKKKKGMLRLQLYDILNDRNNIERFVSSNYLSDSRTNSINQYFMLSFSYKFNITMGKKSNEEQEEIYESGDEYMMYY